MHLNVLSAKKLPVGSKGGTLNLLFKDDYW